MATASDGAHDAELSGGGFEANSGVGVDRVDGRAESAMPFSIAFIIDSASGDAGRAGRIVGAMSDGILAVGAAANLLGHAAVARRFTPHTATVELSARHRPHRRNERHAACCPRGMAPESKNQSAPAHEKPSTPATETARDNGDFADEAGPKDSEFKTEKDAEDITQGEFDKIP